MSSPKFYLIIIKNNLVNSIHTLRELNDLHQLCIEKSQFENCILIHCGITRPKVEHYINFPDNVFGKVLYTEALKWILPKSYKSSRIAVAQITLNEDELPCYLALNQWGYEIDDFESSPKIEKVEFPPLLKKPIEFLQLSRRSQNCLRSDQIRFVGDLIQYTQTSLLNIPNLGKTSLEDIEGALAVHSLSLGTRLREWSSSELEEPILELSDLSLKEHFDRILDMLPEMEKNILVRRLGFCGKILTLNEIGKIFGVTRQRIMQLQQRGITRMKNQINQDDLGNLVEVHIGKLLLDRKKPLILELLDIEDEWFKGFEVNYDSLTSVIQLFAQNNSVHIINAVGRNVVTRITQTEWDTLVSKLGKNLKQKAKEKKWDRSDITQFLESSLFEYDSQELVNLLYENFDIRLRYQDGSQQAPLVAFGKSVESTLMAVLSRAREPLHYSEITQMVSSQSGREVDEHSVHSALSRIQGVWLYGRGTFGLIDHCSLQLSERQRVCSKVEEIIYCARINKQWHSDEIIGQLNTYISDLIEVITPYVLRICIENSPRITYLGRMIWVRSDSGLCVGDRLETTDAFIEILEDAGKPLTSQELKQRLSEARGVSNNMQVHGNERLVQVGRNLWSLSHWLNG